MMKTYCYAGGKITTSDKAFISAYDIGLLRGYAIYEGLTTRNKKVFYLKEHLKRFHVSALKLGLQIPLSNTGIEKILKTLIKKNGFERTNFRMILSGGETLHGIEFDKHKPTFFILAEKWKALPQSLYENGGKLITEEYLRFMPEIKTTHYITAVKFQPKRKKKKAIEILFISKGKVLECSTSNIFMFKGKKLITPQNSVLLGITRKAVLDVARKQFKIEERDITLAELLKAEEVFITSSFKDIVPIVKIDNKIICKGIVGENTKILMNVF